jgi:patatin-like phospholipase/acyl hydrolase
VIPVTPWTGNRFQILSLDGGGLKGILSAALLANWERDLGISVTDHFDLIAGTSTGGLIALGLGARIKPLDIVRFYTEQGPHIFRGPRALRFVLGFFRARYNGRALKRALNDIFADRTLEHSESRLVIPSFNLDEGQVHIFKTHHDDRFKRDYRHKMADVALATSAAPTYLPAFQLGHSFLLDGGVWANNPATVAVTEAVSVLKVPLSAIRVLSIGTTFELPAQTDVLRNAGMIRWALRKQNIASVLLGAQAIAASNTAEHLVGKKSFLRVDPAVVPGSYALDRLSERELLSKAESVSRTYAPQFEEMFVGHTAPSFP